MWDAVTLFGAVLAPGALIEYGDLDNAQGNGSGMSAEATAIDALPMAQSSADSRTLFDDLTASPPGP
jgi:hypothetical protein